MIIVITTIIMILIIIIIIIVMIIIIMIIMITIPVLVRVASSCCMHPSSAQLESWGRNTYDALAEHRPHFPACLLLLWRSTNGTW